MKELLSHVDRDRPEQFPHADHATVHGLLAAQASDDPARLFALFADGTTWTREQTAEETWSVGNALHDLGVVQGETVLVWLPNSPAALRSMLGVAALGAVYVPLNTAYRGSLLAHAINVSRARLMIAHHQLVERLDGIDLPYLRHVVVVGSEVEIRRDLVAHREAQLVGERSNPPPRRAEIQPWDPFAIVFTSGTTGPSKGVLQSYAMYDALCKSMYRGYDHTDRYFAYLPFFHTGGISTVFGMMQHGGSVVVRDGFRVSGYWEDVRRHGVTGACIMGSMGGALFKQPPGPYETDHGLRLVVMAPLVRDVDAFRRRFNVEVFTEYGTTEVGTPLRSSADVTDPTSCGTPALGYEAQVVDSNDLPVMVGELGELVVRHRWPWAIATEYVGMPEATVGAWRNGWFHTGDTFTVDTSGGFHFVDRRVDVIRRRGENIASVEVEREILAHPDVVDAVVVGVPDPIGEQEVMAIVVLRPDVDPAPEALIEFLRHRMPHYMIPRYVDHRSALPRTATEKVQKAMLRSVGVTPNTWDRERAGIVLRRDALT